MICFLFYNEKKNRSNQIKKCVHLKVDFLIYFLGFINKYKLRYSA